MGWFASFKGLRGLGIPPVIAAGVLLVLFFLVKRSDEQGDEHARSHAE